MTQVQLTPSSGSVTALQVSAAGRSHVGCKRKENQDDYLIDLTAGLFVVADGMGGHANGRLASTETVKSFSQSMRNTEYSRASMTSAIQRANQHLIDLNQSLDAGQKRMGTTIVALAVDPEDTGRATLVHVGDSRMYLFRKTATTQITRDHSAREDWIDQGCNGPEPSSNIISRAVGIYRDVEPATCNMTLESGDIALLCTDGLSDYLSTEDITGILSRLNEVGSQRTCDALIELGIERESRDNLTAAIVCFS